MKISNLQSPIFKHSSEDYFCRISAGGRLGSSSAEDKGRRPQEAAGVSGRNNQSGAFTLIEVLVAVSIFAMVMLVATGSVFAIVEANKKSHSLKSVMTNLNFALESMARDIRVGSKYQCDSAGDCSSQVGGTVFSYQANRDVNGSGGDANALDRIEYSRSSDGRIIKTILGNGTQSYPITASEINITSMTFYVIGTGASDGKQPKVIMTISGTAGTGATKSDFNIQTTISQRSIDA